MSAFEVALQPRRLHTVLRGIGADGSSESESSGTGEGAAGGADGDA